MGWKNKPSNFALEVVKNADDHLKKIVGETLQQVVTRSPVMDGEFRASHKVTLASPQNSYEKGFDLSGGSTLAEGLKVASTAKNRRPCLYPDIKPIRYTFRKWVESASA